MRRYEYAKETNSNLVVNPEQAKGVKLIYKLFLTGLSYNAIGHELNKITGWQGKMVCEYGA